MDQALDAQLLVVVIVELHEPVAEDVELAPVQVHLLRPVLHFRNDPERRRLGREGAVAAVAIAQKRRLVAGVCEANQAARRVVGAGHHGHEHAAAAGFVDLAIDDRHDRRRIVAALAEAAKQAGRLGHEQGGVDSLARDVAEGEGNPPVGQGEEIVEVAGYLPDWPVQSVHRKPVRLGARQQTALDLGGQVQLALGDLLTHQFLGHAGIGNGERGRIRHGLEEVGVALPERAARALVDDLDGAERPSVRGQRRA